MRLHLLRVMRAVLWSVFGVRGRSQAARELESTPPSTVIIAAVLVVAIIIGTLLTLTHVIVGGPVRRQPVAPAQGVASVDLKRHGPVVVADTMEERMRPCAACHGAETQATGDGFSPRIAGKPAGYLYNQLASFRDGRRAYPPMVYLVQYMSDDYLREIAAYFSHVELPYPPPEAAILAPEQAARAKQIVEHGDPARNLPACVECHGAALSGSEPAIPSLLGLPRQYMNAQFGAWRNGKLRSVEPDCMAEVAKRLAPEDVPLLTAWLSAQPQSKPGAKPEKLPLECGSLRLRFSKNEPPPGRGAYLVAAGDCIACHTAIGGEPYAGGRAIETPFGTVYSSNITPDPATGIGAWSGEDFWRALHDGRSKDGRLLYPAFPYTNFTQVSRDDADAMFDYLKSLAPVSRKDTPHALRFPYSTQAALAAWRALFFRAGAFEPEPGRSAEWNRGAYLVRGLGHCDACHASRNFFGAVSHQLDLGGGLIPMQNWYAPPIAGRNAELIAQLLATGVSAMGPMAEVVYRSTQHLSDADVRAIATYVASAPQPPSAAAKAPNPRDMARGREVYGEHCAACHGDDGKGAPPIYPALTGNPSVNAVVAANGIKAVLYGGYAPVTARNPRPYGMPPFFSILPDEDVAAVLTYTRASWGNSGGPVLPHEVERYR